MDDIPLKKITAIFLTLCIVGNIFIFTWGQPLTPVESLEYVLEGVQAFDSMEPIDKQIHVKKDAAISVTDPDGTLTLEENGAFTVEGNLTANVDTVDLRNGELSVLYGGECILHADHLLFDKNSRLTISEGGYFEITADDGVKDFLTYVTINNITCRIVTNSETREQTFIIGKRPCSHQNTDTIPAMTVICMDCGAPIAIESMGIASSFSEGNPNLLFGALVYRKKKENSNPS